MVVTTSDIKTQILLGSYTDDIINEDNVFEKEQYARRRRYPSLEIIITDPQGTEETKDQTVVNFSFQIRLFTKNLGDQTDEVGAQNTIETTILAQIESLTLQDHRIVFESKRWKREQFQRDGDHPAYLLSTLTVTVRQVRSPTMTADGILTFINASSTVDNAPGSNSTFDVFNVDIQEGYTGVDEAVTTSPRGFAVPVHYTGRFRGKFIGDVVVKTADIGSTGDKLNKIMTLQSTGEKPELAYTNTNKTNIPSPATITETIKIEIDYVQRRYVSNGNVIYRIVADIIQPSTIAVS